MKSKKFVKVSNYHFTVFVQNTFRPKLVLASNLPLSRNSIQNKNSSNFSAVSIYVSLTFVLL